MGLALAPLVAAASLKGDVEFDQPKRMVGEIMQRAPIGQQVRLGNEGGKVGRLEHGKLRDFRRIRKIQNIRIILIIQTNDSKMLH